MITERGKEIIEVGKTSGKAFLEASYILKEAIRMAWQKSTSPLIERRRLYQSILDEYYAGKVQSLPYTTPFSWSKFKSSWGRMLIETYVRTRI